MDFYDRFSVESRPYGIQSFMIREYAAGARLKLDEQSGYTETVRYEYVGILSRKRVNI